MRTSHLILTFCLPLLSLGLSTGCDDGDDGTSSSSSGGGSSGGGSGATSGSGSATSGGGSTSGNSGGACGTSGGSGGQQCQAYVECVEQNCGNCNTECADFLACNAACDCGNSMCALDCYNNRSPECVTCQNDQATCIADNCLDVGCG